LGHPWPAPAQSRLVVAYPHHGECIGQGAFLRGFAEAASRKLEAPRIFVDGQEASERGKPGGTFGVRVSEPLDRHGAPWSARVEAVYPDGKRLFEDVTLGPCSDARDDAQSNVSEDLGAPISAVARANVRQ